MVPLILLINALPANWLSPHLTCGNLRQHLKGDTGAYIYIIISPGLIIRQLS